MTMLRSIRALAGYIKLFLIIVVYGCVAVDVEINANGEQSKVQYLPQEIQATFINNAKQAVNLYWGGNVNSLKEGALQLYYGVLEPNGGQKTIDGYAGQVFVITEVGTYRRGGEYTLGSTVGTYGDKETYTITDISVKKTVNDFFNDAKYIESNRREDDSKMCRSLTVDSTDANFLDQCTRCAKIDECGFSPTRNACFHSHAIATINDVDECKNLNAIDVLDMSVEALMNRATEITIKEVDKGRSDVLRVAYAYLMSAVVKAEQALGMIKWKDDESTKKALTLNVKKAIVAKLELAAKLTAVFDDQDMTELLQSTRHEKLANILPNMKSVHRRTFQDAKEYIVRGEPVVITDWFDNVSNPVSHKWTLSYLNDMFNTEESLGFNIAADLSTQCCQYFEPQEKARKLGYQYPFSPTTHLYRDSFAGYVKTVRKANRDRTSSKSTKPKLLHYLHEIVMKRDGKATIGGGSAPKQLITDLDSITSQLRPIALKQPFFGDFSYAKIWSGMKGIVMPAHYDATDNLYVMAWGRKKAYIGDPGQLDDMYRYPNGHPLVGSSQVNLTDPDLKDYPNFKYAYLREVVVGPGDILYLPALWWHQFEQPFEDTLALNIWSRDREDAPDTHVRSNMMREILLADQLEEAVARNNRQEAGTLFDALHWNNESPFYDRYSDEKLQKENETLLEEARKWKQDMNRLPGGDHLHKTAEELVKEHIAYLHGSVFPDPLTDPDWKPGDSWYLGDITELTRDLRERCKPAPNSFRYGYTPATGVSSPFTSVCED